MDAIAGVTFARPDLMVALAALPLAAWFLVARERTRRRLADGFASERIRGVRTPARLLRPWLLSAGLLASALALPGPRFGEELVPVPQDDRATVILLDISASMAATDTGISRLDAAKVVIRRMLEKDRGRVALFAFEGVAELVSPLTTDTIAVGELAASFGTGELPVAGSDLGAAILNGIELLQRTGGGRREIVLLSDGEDQGTLLDEAIARAQRERIPVTTMLFGSEEGATIRVPGERDVLHDDEGNVVTTRASAGTLKRIAEGTGGRWIESPLEAQTLLRVASGIDGAGTVDEERFRRVPTERYQWTLALGLALLMLGSWFHRGGE